MADPLMRAYVRFLADDTGLREDAKAKVTAATAGMVAKARIELDTDQAERKRTELQARLAAMGATAARIQARLDVDDKAGIAKVDAWRVRLLALDAQMRRLSNTEIDPKVKLQGLVRAQAQISALDAQMAKADKTGTRFGSSLENAAGKVSLLWTGVLAAAPAALAMIGAATAGVIGFAGVLTAGAASLGVFGVTAKTQLTGLADGYKNIEKLKEAAAKAPAGSKQQITDLKNLAAAQKAYTATFGPAAAAFSNLQSAWKRWQDSTRESTLPVLADGMNILAQALPKLRPLLDEGAVAAQRFLAAIQAWISGGGLDRAVMLLARLASTTGPYIQATLSNLARAAGALAPMMVQLGVAVARGMADITGSLASWATGGGGARAFQSFMDFVRQNGPAIVSALTSLAGAAVNIVRSMAPFAPVSLAVADGLAKLIGAAPPSVLQAAAVGYLAVAAGLKAMAAVKTISVATGLASIGAAAGPVGLVVAAVIALGAAFYLAWEKSAGFREFMKGFAAGMLQFGIVVVSGAKMVTDAVLSMIGTILHGAVTAFGWVPGLGDKLRGASKAFDEFKGSTDNTFNHIIGTMQSWQLQLSRSQAAVSAATAVIAGDFTRQGQAADGARAALLQYTNAILANGVNSAAAKAARDQLVRDLQAAGVGSTTAQRDVAAYTAAVAANGVTSNAAGTARLTLINDIMRASGNARQGKTDLNAYTDAVNRNGSQSTAAQSARQTLINDLVKAGVSSSTAKTLVDDLTRSLNGLPKSKQVGVTVTTSASGGLTVTGGGPGLANVIAHVTLGRAKGGLITGGIPGTDSVLGMLMPGELVVPTAMVRAGAVDHLRGRLPGFAGGGLVGWPAVTSAVSGWPGQVSGAFSTGAGRMEGQVTAKIIEEIISKLRAAAAPTATGGYLPVYGAPAAGSLQQMAQQMLNARGWGSQWAAFNSLEMQEAGWNMYARNPMSGAYGLAQGITGPSWYYGQGGDPNTAQGQLTAMMNYIAGRYGDPNAAWAHEIAYNWYDQGGWLPPGLSAAYNGTGQPERVLPPGGGDGLTQRLDRLIAQIERLTEVTAAVPARTGQHVTAGIGTTAAAAAFRARYPAGAF